MRSGRQGFGRWRSPTASRREPGCVRAGDRPGRGIAVHAGYRVDLLPQQRRVLDATSPEAARLDQGVWPDFTGWPIEDVFPFLSSGVGAETRRGYSDEVDYDHVITTDPRPGTIASDFIRFWVSGTARHHRSIRPTRFPTHPRPTFRTTLSNTSNVGRTRPARPCNRPDGRHRSGATNVVTSRRHSRVVRCVGQRVDEPLLIDGNADGDQRGESDHAVTGAPVFGDRCRARHRTRLKVAAAAVRTERRHKDAERNCEPLRTAWRCRACGGKAGRRFPGSPAGDACCVVVGVSGHDHREVPDHVHHFIYCG